MNAAPGIDLPEGCSLTYYLPHEAFYAAALAEAGLQDDAPFMFISAAYPNGSREWEFRIEQSTLAGGTVRLLMFAEAFEALHRIRPFFDLLVDQCPATLDAVRELLDSLGATDTTERTPGGAR